MRRIPIKTILLVVVLGIVGYFSWTAFRKDNIETTTPSYDTKATADFKPDSASYEEAKVYYKTQVPPATAKKMEQDEVKFRETGKDMTKAEFNTKIDQLIEDSRKQSSNLN